MIGRVEMPSLLYVHKRMLVRLKNKTKQTNKGKKKNRFVFGRWPENLNVKCIFPPFYAKVLLLKGKFSSEHPHNDIDESLFVCAEF